mmetsp:Transcript_17238/g.30225  ORF Transcript_17238/g.30225 Transcript_17238/m.30225 type:complete len:430 (+) Transcript_17238:38-1327(+)
MPRPPLARKADMFFFGGGAGGAGAGAKGKGGGKGPGDKGFHEDTDATQSEFNNQRLYELLGVDRQASSSEIKKAYHRMAMKHHPDKGGDPETFKDIQRAFEVLSDSEQRERYDAMGEEALNEDGGSSPHGIFEQLFGKGKGRGRGQPRTKDNVRPVWVTLEDLYSGVTRQLPIIRKVIDAAGGASTCSACNGEGRVIQVVRMGPMIQQLQQSCPKCQGSGSSAKMKSQREVLEVFVEKGSPAGHKIVVHGKADEAPGCEPGDVVVVVRLQEHPRFLRKEADLYMQVEVSLAEALMGFRIAVPHLDGRTLLVRNKPGEVLKPKQGSLVLKGVRDGGMPIHQDPFNFGNLFLVISIRFPDVIDFDGSGAKQLRQLLNYDPEKELDAEDVEEAFAEDIEPLQSWKQSKKASSQAYDEDDGHGMPDGIECKQQ